MIFLGILVQAALDFQEGGQPEIRQAVARLELLEAEMERIEHVVAGLVVGADEGEDATDGAGSGKRVVRADGRLRLGSGIVRSLAA